MVGAFVGGGFCHYHCNHLLEFPVADVVSDDGPMGQPRVWVIPCQLQAGGGDSGDADVPGGSCWSLAIRHELQRIRKY